MMPKSKKKGCASADLKTAGQPRRNQLQKEKKNQGFPTTFLFGLTLFIALSFISCG
jgi:hypothetical protein